MENKYITREIDNCMIVYKVLGETKEYFSVMLIGYTYTFKSSTILGEHKWERRVQKIYTQYKGPYYAHEIKYPYYGE